MLNSAEVKEEDPKSGLFCIARKISHNERSIVTPVEPFTTKSNIDDLLIHAIDTTGKYNLYVNFNNFKTTLSKHKGFLKSAYIVLFCV